MSKFYRILVILVWGAWGFNAASEELSVTFSMGRSYFSSQSRSSLTGSYFTPTIGYYDRFKDIWRLGLTAGVIKAYEREQGVCKYIANFSSGSYYSVRLYEPVYLHVGFKLLYFYPVQQLTPPFRRDPQYNAEVGAAFSTMITSKLGASGYEGLLYYDLWRGTGSRTIMGSSLGLGLGRMLD